MGIFFEHTFVYHVYLAEVPKEAKDVKTPVTRITSEKKCYVGWGNKPGSSARAPSALNHLSNKQQIKFER